MKHLYRLFLSLLFLAVVSITPLSAWSWIYVQNPHTWGKWGQGSIEEAILKVEPKGLYMDYDLTLTLSGKGNNFTAQDTLEISYYFSLPENSIVYDSWLWVGDSMVHAKLMDRWSAWQIYESIVKRRTDPSVLYKDWNNYYHLQVYPLMGNDSRKVRIQFLVPSRWGNKSVSCPLPLDMLKSSYTPLEKLTLLVKENKEFKNTALPTVPNATFENYVHPLFGTCKKTVIPKNYLSYNQVHLSFSNPVKNGIYLGKFDQAGSGFYQMALMPSQLFNLNEPKKLLFLFDFENSSSTYTRGKQVWAELQDLLYNYLDEGDYFNVILSGPTPRLVSQDWISADPASLASLFHALGEEPVRDYSNLKPTLVKGIQYAKSHGPGVTMVLLSNSDNYGDQDTANTLFEDIKDLAPLPVTHVVDFNETYHWFYFGNNYFRGNEYFYKLITRYTKGNYFQFNYWSNNIADIISPIFELAGGVITSYDLHTRLQDGFCFGRYNLEKEEQVIYLDKPVLQLGNYHGSFPFIAEMAGIYKGEPIAVSRNIGVEEAHSSDSAILKMWAGNYIAALEEDWTWDNARISDIIDNSLNYHVLSNYTAFLALEPGMDAEENPEDPGEQPNGSSGDRSLSDNSFYGSDGKEIMIGILQDSLRARVYPNPFHNLCRIELSVGGMQLLGNLQLAVEVYDLSGRKLRSFSPQQLFFNGQMTIVWDGTDESGTPLKEGVYCLRIHSSSFKKELRLIKL